MKKSIYICLVLSALCTMAYAVPAHPGLRTRTLADGTRQTYYVHGDEFYHWETSTLEPILTQEQQAHRAAALTKAAHRMPATIGVPYLPKRGLVILANFKDRKFKPENTQAQMDSLCNGLNYTYNGAYKSAAQYFKDQSNGHYCPKFDVVGPVELDSCYAYYGKNTPNDNGNDRYMADVIIESCQKAKTQFNVDFTQYAVANPNEVDIVFVIYAGYGENETDDNDHDCLWPLQYTIDDACYWGYISNRFSKKDATIDGKRINMFVYTNELQYPSDARCGIGTLCHEFGHVLGLADYYNTVGNSYYSTLPFYWHTMDRGCYNDDGNRPPSYSPFEKFFFGWVTPQLLSKEQLVYTLPADGKTYAYLPKSGAAIDPTQYEDTVYYFENRQAQGWDKGLQKGVGPALGKGMLIWRVVFNKALWKDNEVNNSQNAPRISIVPSDGGKVVHNNNLDVYPGTNNVTTRQLFDDWTIYRIKDTEGVITFQTKDIPTGWQSPLLKTYRKVLDQGQVKIIDPKTNKSYTVLGNE